MFYKIKKKIISSNMRKKKLNNPFNLVESETYTFKGDEDTSINNSYFFTAHNEKGDSIVVRLGLRNNMPSEVFFFYKLNGLFLVHEYDHYPFDNCPVKVNVIEPGKTWKFTFDGKLKDYNSNELYDVKIDATFIASLPIFDFFYDSSSKAMAEAIAKEKWNKEFFNAISTNNQRHYEQTGYLKGTALINKKEEAFNLSCVRDHSFGTRNWDYMDDHIWICGINDNNEVINFSFVNYPNMKKIYLGYNNINKKENVILDGYNLKNYDINNGLGPDTSIIITNFDDNSSFEVVCKREANVPIYFDDGKYCFQEAIGELIVNGKKFRGTIEYGFNKNKNRWNY